MKCGVLRTNKHFVMRRIQFLAVGLGGLAIWIAAARALPAQQALSSAPVSDSACTYAQCSLWLYAGALVRGADARVIASRGLFRPLHVLPFLAGDSARHYATLYEHNGRRASRFSLAAAALVVAGFVVALTADCDAIATPFGETCQDDASGPIAAGLVLGGLTLDVFVVIPISNRANRSLVRALWWHNSQYAR